MSIATTHQWIFGAIFSTTTTTNADKQLRFVMDTSNSTYNNNYNDTAVCHPLLLAQGNKSQVGLCDDTPSSVAISAIVLFVHTTLLIVSIGGLIYKLRRIQQLKKDGKKHVVNYLQVARDPALMVLAAFCGWVYSFVFMTRVMIGRKIYPCFIFSLVYYLAVPALANALILRCIRLLVLTKLNELKIRIGKRQYELHPTTSSENIKPLMDVNASLKLDTISTGKETSEISLESNNEMKELKRTSDVGASSSNLSTISSTKSGNRLSLSALTIGRTSSILSQFTIEPKDNVDEKEIQDEMIFRKETLLESFERGKLLSIFKFLVSSKFVYIYYTILILFHVIIFFIVATIDYFNYQNDNLLDSKQKRNSFTIDSYLLSPSGCGTGAYNQYIFISYMGFYGLIGVVFSIIAFMAKRDVWNVKIEIVMINLAWVLVIILYGVPSLFTIITTFVDYYFPWSITILMGCMWDTLISFTYPVFILQRFKKTKSSDTTTDSDQQPTSNHQLISQLPRTTSTIEKTSSIKKILNNEKWNALFVQFSEKCFACEDVMMWNTIQKYRDIASEKQRRELFYNICNTYIRVGSPLELNIPRKSYRIPEIMQIYKSMKESNINYASKNGSVSPSPKSSPKKGNSPNTNSDMSFLFSITPDIFDRIQSFCEQNMMDNYTRFQSNYEKQLNKELGISSKMKV